MKHIFSLFSIACVAFFTILLSTTGTSCKKGDAGPAGPKGDTGIANMIYSNWLDVTYTNQGDTFFFANINAPKLTNTFLNTGAVKVYVNIGTPTTPNVISLPLGYSIIPIFSAGNIRLNGDDDYGTFTGTDGAKHWQYRYILLGGTIPARSSTNWNNYTEVQKLLGLKD